MKQVGSMISSFMRQCVPSDDDRLNEMQEKIRARSDSELLEMLDDKPGYWSPVALKFAKSEIEKRPGLLEKNEKILETRQEFDECEHKKEDQGEQMCLEKNQIEKERPSSVSHGDASPDMIAMASVFLEDEEVLVSKLSRGYVSNLLLGGTLSSNFVILSDRRIYYSGSFFSRVGYTMKKCTGQIILPLQQITSISFLEKKNIGFLISAFILLIIGLTIGFLAANASDGVSFMALLPSVALFITYLLSINRFFVVSSDSASIQINYKLYGETDIRIFSHDLGKMLTTFHAKGLGK